MPTIILSYRRDDTRWIAGRIFDRMERRYGRYNVFMDIDAIPYGMDFRQHIRAVLQKCDIMLAIIGPRWAMPSEDGRLRLADKTDWVRIEIEAALAKKIPVIPVRVDGAALPSPRQLPKSLRELVFRQAAELDAGLDFNSHIERLIRAMDHLLAQKHDPVPATLTERTTATVAEGLVEELRGIGKRLTEGEVLQASSDRSGASDFGANQQGEHCDTRVRASQRTGRERMGKKSHDKTP